MRNNDGFVKCKNENWEIYNDQEDKDYICRGEGNYGWFCAYYDRTKCPYFEPVERSEKENEND